MFKKNIEALTSKNPILAKKLQEISILEVRDDIEVYQAESNDLIISYQGLALDDIYDPIRVAKTNWKMNAPEKLTPYDIVVVFGLGLGYLFRRAYVSCNSRIVVYEPELEILRFVLEYVDFSNEIKDNRIHFASDKQDALNFISDKYLSDDKLVFLYPQAYAQLCTNLLADFTNDIVEVCNMKKMDVNTISALSKKWAEQTLVNLSNMKKTRPISLLKDKYNGKTAIIAAAGPSLADNIELIKKHREKFIIFAINRTASTLLNQGIKPDFVVFVDATNLLPTIEGIEDELENIPLIVEARTNSAIFEKFNNIYTYFPKVDLISQKINQVTNNEIELLETAGTSSAQAYYSAKYLGFKNIIFAGLDLVFKDGTLYASGEKAKIDKENNEIDLGGWAKVKKNLVNVKSITGQDVLTRDDYALFIRQFSDIFENEKDLNIYNLSSFGALIKGMQYAKLEDIIKDTETTPFFDALKYIPATNETWNKTYKTIIEFINQNKIALIEIFNKAKTIYIIDDKLMNEFYKNIENISIREELMSISNEFSAFLKEIMENPFLMEHFQGDLTKFVSVCNKKSNTIDDFIEFKKFEINLLKEIVELEDIWTPLFERFNF